jgi:hypothetical protein
MFVANPLKLPNVRLNGNGHPLISQPQVTRKFQDFPPLCRDRRPPKFTAALMPELGVTNTLVR